MKGITEAMIEDAKRRGLVVTERHCGPVSVLPIASADESEPAKVELLPSVHLPPGMWIVGVETRSETNQRNWKQRSGRTVKARRAVSELFGKTLRSLTPFAEHYHAGGSLRVRFVRLAPCRLDRGNISAAVKAVEDAVCLMLGADDGSPQWLATYEQEASDRYGVRVELYAEHINE